MMRGAEGMEHLVSPLNDTRIHDAIITNSPSTLLLWISRQMGVCDLSNPIERSFPISLIEFGIQN